MGKKSKKFIEKNEGQHFHLTYRSQRDEAYANDERPSDFVLVPSNRENTSSGKVYTNISDIIQNHSSSSSNGGASKDHINALGFKNDGYDYEQHFRVMGGGKFIGKDGKFADDPMISSNNNYTPAVGTSGTGNHSSREGSTSRDLPDDVFASEGELDRNYQAITISAEFMEEDIRAGLFEDEDENGESFETLDDDFIQQVTQEPEIPDFDFDAHMAKLFALSEKSLKGGHTCSSAARGWEKQSTHHTTGSSINNLSGGELKGHFLKRKYKNKMSGISAMNSNYLIEERDDDNESDDEDEEEDDDSNNYSDDDNNDNDNNNIDNNNTVDDEEFNKLLENEYDDDQIGYIDDDDEEEEEDGENGSGNDGEDSSNDGDDEEDNDDMQQQQQNQSIKKKNLKTVRAGGGVQGTIDVNDEKNELLNSAMEEFLLEQKDSAMYEGVALNDIEAMKLKIMKFRSNIIDDDENDNNNASNTNGNNKNDKDKTIIQQLADINITDNNNNNAATSNKIKTTNNKNNLSKSGNANNTIDYKREYELQLASQKESAELFPEYVGNIKKALTDFTNDVYTTTPHNSTSISHTNSNMLNGRNSTKSVSAGSSNMNNDINANIKNAFSLMGSKNNNNNTINNITNAQQTTTVIGATILPVVTEVEEEKEEGMQGYFENQEYLKNETIREQWDCETVLSTYSTLDNHPTVIRDAKSKFKPYQSKHDRYLEQQQQQISNANNKLDGDSDFISISDNESIHSKLTAHTKNTHFASHTHHSVRTSGGTTSALSNQIKQTVQARVAIAPNFIKFRDISSNINNSVIDKAQPVSQIINSSISSTVAASNDNTTATQPISNKNINNSDAANEIAINGRNNSKNGINEDDDEDEDDGGEDDDNTIMTNTNNNSNGNSRRNETKEEKKLRKQMVKAERKEKRSNKKQLKEAFKTELTKYNGTNQPSIGNVEKLSVYKYTS